MICGLVDVTYIVSASDFDVDARNDMQTFFIALIIIGHFSKKKEYTQKYTFSFL